MLSVLPRRYGQIAMSIETLVDLDMFSINELVGRLNAAEERYALDHDLTAGIGELLLTEEWCTRTKSRGGGLGSDRRRDKGSDRGKDVARRDGNSSGATCRKKGRSERKRTRLARPMATTAIRTSSWLWSPLHLSYLRMWADKSSSTRLRQCTCPFQRLLAFTISSVCMLICNRTYTWADILKMERTIVDMLELDMFVTTPYCLM